MAIRVKSFEHHNFYMRYRLHCENMKSLPIRLKEYLLGIFDHIPKDLFTHPDNPGCSGMRLDFKNIEMEECAHHPIIEQAQQSREHTRFKSRHENLQQWFLLNDPTAIAAELPVWMDEVESKIHLEICFPVTGHIDLLRYDDSKIQIWDYKPNAKREKWARTQVCLYALLLSLRTGISLEDMVCGYFDENVAFTFSPAQIRV